MANSAINPALLIPTAGITNAMLASGISAAKITADNLPVAQLPLGGAWALTSDLTLKNSTTHTSVNISTTGAALVSNLCFYNNTAVNWIFSSRGTIDATNNRLALLSNTGSTEVMTWCQDGKVGIGTAIPGNARLDIQNTESGSLALYVRGSTYGGHTDSYGMRISAGSSASDYAMAVFDHTDNASLFYIQGDGKVGIGTVSPKVQVHVVSGSPVVSITGTGVAATPYMNFFRNSTTLLGAIETGVNAAGNDVGDCLRIFNNIATSGYIYVIAGAASGTGVYLAGGATSWSSNSDERLKENIVPITDASDKVVSLRAVSFNFKSDEKKTSRVGLIAQDVRKVLPQAVDEDADGTLSLRYTEVIPLLVAAHNEQQETINHLKSEISKLKEKQ